MSCRPPLRSYEGRLVADSGFDLTNWIQRLGSELDGVAEGAVPSVRASFGSPPCRSLEGDRMWYMQQYRQLAARAKGDPGARKAFENSHLNLIVHPARARQILQEHPSLALRLAHSGAGKGLRFVRITDGFGANLEFVISYLAKLAVQEGGRHAAELLSMYLEAGERAELPGYQVILLHGLELDRRFDVSPDAYVAPYSVVRAQFNLPEKPEDWLRHTNLADDYAIGASATCALVRGLRWGPGVVSMESDEVSTTEPVRIRYRFPGDYEVDIERSWEDRRMLVALLSVAIRKPVVSNTVRVFPEAWLAKIDPNFRHASSNGKSTRADIWPDPPHHFTRDDADAFRALAGSWRSYQERKRSPIDLAIRRMSYSFARGGGFFGIEDRILDVAIALEIMYGSPNHGITEKLCKRADALLGGNHGDSDQASSAMTRFYNIRSALVHGREGIEGDPTKFEESLQEGQDLACRTLETLLAHGPISHWGQYVVERRKGRL